MAIQLVKCAACGKELSHTAISCPNCGHQNMSKKCKDCWYFRKSHYGDYGLCDATKSSEGRVEADKIACPHYYR